MTQDEDDRRERAIRNVRLLYLIDEEFARGVQEIVANGE